MSKPVPVQRSKLFPADKPEEDEPTRCIVIPTSPELVEEPLVKDDCEVQPLLQDANSYMQWWKNPTPWRNLCNGVKDEKRIIKFKAEQLYKATQVYTILLIKHEDILKEHTAELLCIADNLDKVSKGTKIAGITGATTSVAGGVAAAAGVILSPFTLGASLALTVVGVGAVTAGGLTGASAAIANKVSSTQYKKKIEKCISEYGENLSKVLDCLKFISEGMEQLKKHDLSVLSEAKKELGQVCGMIQLAISGGGGGKAIEANSEALGMMHGLTLGLDMHFTQGKDGMKVKKGHKSKLAKKIRELAQELNDGLKELDQINQSFSEIVSVS